MNERQISNFREKIKENKVFGLFMKTSDSAFVEVAGYAGCDFVILDMEHGPVGIEGMQDNIRAAQISGTLPIIRVPSLSEEGIAKALDIGAAGIQIPQVKNAIQAREAVNMAKFYPMGERGVCRFVRAANYSAISGDEYYDRANKSLLIIQLEGREAVENIDEILEVEGIDIIFIGPYDLSQSLGIPGDITNSKVVNLMKKIIEKAKYKDIITGTFTDSEETMKMWVNAGVQYISYSVDVGIFKVACSNLKDTFVSISSEK